MHMADALLSPTVGMGFLAASGGVLAYSAKRVQDEGDELAVRYGPIPMFAKTIPYAQITAVEPGRTNLIDGWGTPFRVSADGTEITIVSAGPDREFDTGDDLKQ